MDAVLFIVSNSLGVYEDLCVFMVEVDKLTGVRKKGKDILPIERLEQNITAVVSVMAENFVSSMSFAIGRYAAGGDDAQKGPSAVSSSEGTPPLDLKPIISYILSEYSKAFGKIRAYLSDGISARQIAETLVVRSSSLFFKLSDNSSFRINSSQMYWSLLVL